MSGTGTKFEIHPPFLHHVELQALDTFLHHVELQFLSSNWSSDWHFPDLLKPLISFCTPRLPSEMCLVSLSCLIVFNIAIVRYLKDHYRGLLYHFFRCML